MSRHPSLVTGRPTRRRGLFAASALVAAGISIGMVSVAPRAATAAEPMAASGLDGKFSDVAFIERGPGQWPDLLTIDAVEESSPAASLTLFRRDEGWSKLAEAPVTHGILIDITSTSWLVDLGGNRLALLTVSGAEPLTTVVALDVDGGRGSDAIRAGEPIAIDMNVISAGAADVDGSGTMDLALVGSRDVDPYGECAGSTVLTLDGDDLSPRDGYEMPHLRIAGAAIGEWDGRPGADLLGHWYATCPADVEAAPQHHLLAMRLADGSTIVDLQARDGEPDLDWPGNPLVVDVDGDGRDEAVVRGSDRLVVLDPTDSWNPLLIATGDVVPLAARRVPGASGAPSAGVAQWASGFTSDGSLQAGTTRIERVEGALRVAAVDQQPVAMTVGERDAVWSRLVEAGGSEQPAPAWSIDVDGDDCPELVTLRFRLGCDGTGLPAPGPEWLSTGVLGTFGPPGDRRVLTTVGVDWYPYQGAPMLPTPSAAWPDGAWRHGWSPWFGLADVPAEGLAGGSDLAVGQPVIDGYATRDGTIQLHAPSGARLLVRAVALKPEELSVALVPDRDAFLRSDPGEGEFVMLMHVPTSGEGTTPGTTGSVDFEIRSMVPDAFGVQAERWRVTAATLGPSGDVSNPAHAMVVWDIVAPTIAAEAPLLSAPWPFQGTLRGTSEAGTEVRAGGGPPVVVGRDGSFDVDVQLAPWPQTLELSSTDPSGNVATTEVSVMGGVDLRQLPWPAIGTVVVIVAVFASSLRGRRGVQQVATIEVEDGEHLPVIEELSAGRIPPRD